MEKSVELPAGFPPLTEQELKSYSALSFAYVGDSVYELIIRTKILFMGNSRPNKYHGQVVNYVNAHGQTKLMNQILPLLTKEELAMFRRGKNAKPASIAKNQTHHDYRIATGFETLSGYLYLSGQTERLIQLVNAGLSQWDEES